MTGEIVFESDWHLRPDGALATSDNAGFTALTNNNGRAPNIFSFKSGQLCADTDMENMFAALSFTPTGLRSGTLALRANWLFFGEIFLVVNRLATLSLFHDFGAGRIRVLLLVGQNSAFPSPAASDVLAEFPFFRDGRAGSLAAVLTWSITDAAASPDNLARSGLRLFFNQNTTAA